MYSVIRERSPNRTTGYRIVVCGVCHVSDQGRDRFSGIRASMPSHRDREPNLAELVASARVMAVEIDRPLTNPIEGTQGVVAGHDDRVLNLIQEVSLKIAPPPFKGSINPDDAELWIEEMEKAFVAMRFSDQDKIRFAVYLLQGSAHNWWKGVTRTHDNDPEFFNWENFRTTFYAKYFPRSKLLQLEREFLNLVKGSMTVDDYEAKFDRLSKFVTALVFDDESRARRFENGLNAHIRRGLAPLHLISYNEVVVCGGGHQAIEYRRVTGAYFRCGQLGHRIAYCPLVLPECQSVQKPQNSRTFETTAQRTQPTHVVQTTQAPSSRHQKVGRPRTQGRGYAITQSDVEASNTVVSGTLLVASAFAHVLFDTGASHSFVSVAFVRKFTLPCMLLDYELCVDTLVRDFDVILGMDWLVANFAKVDCRGKRVDFKILGETPFYFCGSDTRMKELRIEEIPIVREFPDVFPEDPPNLPLDREIDFSIDLVPGTGPISKAPYRMAPAELKELKE
ncbi:Retrotransposon gag domain - like 10 [Theobroma cacao]|nr:Retrotransposon gag domain - like 10 [Theobroma cacao]